jgi:hypothetical protein
MISLFQRRCWNLASASTHGLLRMSLRDSHGQSHGAHQAREMHRNSSLWQKRAVSIADRQALQSHAILAQARRSVFSADGIFQFADWAWPLTAGLQFG